MALRDITIGSHKFAPKSFEKINKVIRYGTRALLIETGDGKIYGAALSHHTYFPSLEDAALISALVKLGKVTRSEVKQFKTNARLREQEYIRAEDLRTLSRITGKYGIALTPRQLKQMANGKRI